MAETIKQRDVIDRRRNILLCGGVPGESVEEVLRTCSAAFGDRVLALPDGELGERRGWILALNDAVWPNVGGIEEVQSPLPGDHPYGVFRSFRIEDGAADISAQGKLPYARGAIESYAVFERLRAQGVIEPGVRFQVSVPTSHAAVAVYFPRYNDWPRAFRAWTSALDAEYRCILEVIPAEDLVLQLDYCTELVHIHGELPELMGWFPEMTQAEAFAAYTDESYLVPHTASLPAEVVLGYHICAGTYPRQPVSDLQDMTLPVDLANALATNSGRRVDYFHMPVMRDRDEAYFAPLKRLDVGTTAVYLGLECNDGPSAMQRRMTDARNYLADFGVAHYCGYSWNAEVLPQLLSDLAAGARQVASRP